MEFEEAAAHVGGHLGRTIYTTDEQAFEVFRIASVSKGKLYYKGFSAKNDGSIRIEHIQKIR